MLCVFCFVSIGLKAQSKTSPKSNLNAPAKTQTSISPKQEGFQHNREAENNKREIEEKARAIEASNASPEEKEKMRAELGKYGKANRKEICFNPKTVPTALLEKFQDIFAEEAKAYLSNIVILNEAIALDFNMYADADQAYKWAEAARGFYFDEKSTLLYVLPNLTLMQKMKGENTIELIKSVRLYFQHQPELYNFIPIEIKKMLQNPEAMLELQQKQQKYLSNS
jgi:hypothetical protein